MTQDKNNRSITKSEMKLLKDGLWMGVLWAQSLIDSDVPNGKRDYTKAKKAYFLIKNKLENATEKVTQKLKQ